MCCINLLTGINQESPILNLTNDCFRFVIGFFEVINTSVPHIYHSALLLCPEESIVKQLYGQQVKPMVRVIQGIPASWDPSIADIRLPEWICAAAWSPCSRFIAAAYNECSEIAILDPVTLKQLHTLSPPQEEISWTQITFSPESHLLTAHSWDENCIINWDLQTGGLLSNINTEEFPMCNSVSYSGSERMIGGLFDNTTIITYNVLTGKCMTSHSIENSFVETIWSHGEYLQFATLESESIIIWQVSFTSSNPPIKIGSLSTPDNFSSEELVLFPTLSRLAFILDGEIFVWDALQNRVLLHSLDIEKPRAISFSPDGHSFVCGTGSREFYIWKETPTGYVSRQQLVTGATGTRPLISPNGGSVISSSDNILQLWHTTGLPTSISRVSTKNSRKDAWYCVEFSLDGTLVAVAEGSSRTVTLYDMESGNPWLVIDTGTDTCGLRMTEDEIIVVGDGKIVTWDLPIRNCTFEGKKTINDSVHTTVFVHSTHIGRLSASISPTLEYIAFGDRSGILAVFSIDIYHMHTGEKLATATSGGSIPGFTPSGHEVWCTTYTGNVDQWEIVKEKGSEAIELKEIKKNMKPISGFPWLSSDGHQVTNDGWIICSSGKRLLMLPHYLQQSATIERKWSGKSLVIWNKNTPEPCILKLEV